MDLSSYDWVNDERYKKLPELLSPLEVSKLLRVNVKTIYDWKYRAKAYKPPQDLFHHFGKRVGIRKTVLRQWWFNRNSR